MQPPAAIIIVSEIDPLFYSTVGFKHCNVSHLNNLTEYNSSNSFDSDPLLQGGEFPQPPVNLYDIFNSNSPYLLSTNSDCINSGYNDASSLVPSEDIRGVSRPLTNGGGLYVDIGPYEQ
jgi:hypothetical protein